MSELITPPSQAPQTPGCPLGWFGMGLPGRIVLGTQEVQVQNIMPPCQEHKCMFWREVSQGIIGGEHEEQVVEYDCVLVRACEALGANAIG